MISSSSSKTSFPDEDVITFERGLMEAVNENIFLDEEVVETFDNLLKEELNQFEFSSKTITGSRFFSLKEWCTTTSNPAAYGYDATRQYLDNSKQHTELGGGNATVWLSLEKSKMIVKNFWIYLAPTPTSAPGLPPALVQVTLYKGGEEVYTGEYDLSFVPEEHNNGFMNVDLFADYTGYCDSIKIETKTAGRNYIALDQFTYVK